MLGFLTDDDPWSGRPVEVDSNQMETLIEDNQLMPSGTADTLKIPKSSVENNLSPWLFNQFDVWVSHKFNKIWTVSERDSLLRCKKML